MEFQEHHLISLLQWYGELGLSRRCTSVLAYPKQTHNSIYGLPSPPLSIMSLTTAWERRTTWSAKISFVSKSQKESQVRHTKSIGNLSKDFVGGDKFLGGHRDFLLGLFGPTSSISIIYYDIHRQWTRLLFTKELLRLLSNYYFSRPF